MKLKILTTIMIAASAAGCASNTPIERPGFAYGCPAGDGKIGSKPDLIKAKLEIAGALPKIEVTDLRCAERANLLRVDVDLRNESKEVRRIAYRFRWLDKDGMRAWDDESWKPVLLYGNTLYTVTTMSPSPDATDFRVVVMDQDNK